MKSKSKKITASSADLAGLINQSSADKLLNSVAFPFMLIDISNPPPGNLLTNKGINEDEVTLSEKIVTKLLKEIAESAKIISTESPKTDSKFYSEALSNLAPTIESAKSFLKAKDDADNAKPPIPFEGPPIKFAEDILKNGVEGLGNIKGIEFRAICSKLQVIADNKPNLHLNGSNISISNSKITTNATGELWWYHPTLHCSRWCTRWSVTWGWDRVASISVSVRVDLDGYVEIRINGKIVCANLHINKLRLDYPILREIPLEGIANRILANKQIPVFDASSFVACIPVLNSRFAIDSISIPISNGLIEIDIAIKQV